MPKGNSVEFVAERLDSAVVGLLACADKLIEMQIAGELGALGAVELVALLEGAAEKVSQAAGVLLLQQIEEKGTDDASKTVG